MEFNLEVKEERLMGVEHEHCSCKRKVQERESLNLEIKELELQKRELERNSAEKLKLLEMVESNAMEMLVKLKEYQDLVKGGKELEVWKKKLESKVRDFEAYAEEQYKGLQLKEDQCRAQSELLERRERELELREKKFEGRVKAFEIRKKDFPLKEAQCLAQSKLLDKRERELELRIQKFEERVKASGIRKNESELKGRRIVNESLGVDDDSCGTIVLQIELEGNDVHMLLDGHKIDLSSRDEVSNVLRLSGDPSLVVLEALEVISPPYIAKFGRTFNGKVARACLYLLEQLFDIRPKIESAGRENALKLAQKWKNVLSDRKSLEVLAFLYLLASFDLVHSFDIKEVKKLFQTVPKHEKVPALCHRLGLKLKIPDFIKDLIGKKQRVLAVDYAYEFNLVHMFPPVNLLKQHVLELKSAAKKPEDLATISSEITELEKVIKCIANHNLESKYPPNGLMQRVAELEKRRKMLKIESRKRAANEGKAPPSKKLSR